MMKSVGSPSTAAVTRITSTEEPQHKAPPARTIAAAASAASGGATRLSPSPVARLHSREERRSANPIVHGAAARHMAVASNDVLSDTFLISESTAPAHGASEEDPGTDVSWVDVSQPTQSIITERVGHMGDGRDRTFSLDMTSEMDLMSVDRADLIRHTFRKRERKLLRLEAEHRAYLCEAARLARHSLVMQAVRDGFALERRAMFRDYVAKRTDMQLGVREAEEAMHRQYIGQAYAVSWAALCSASHRACSALREEPAALHKTLDSHTGMHSAAIEVPLTTSSPASDDEDSGMPRSLSVSVRRLSRARAGRPSSAPMCAVRRVGEPATPSPRDLSSTSTAYSASVGLTRVGTSYEKNDLRRALRERTKRATSGRMPSAPDPFHDSDSDTDSIPRGLFVSIDGTAKAS